MGNTHAWVHTDHDGFGCGAIIKQRYPDARINVITYSQTIKGMEHVSPGDTIFVADFSFPLEVMQDLDKRFNLIWIDHHKNVYESYAAAGFNPQGIRDSNVAACVSTWKYCYGDTRPVPESVIKISRWDIWQLNKDVIGFHYALDMLDLRPYPSNMKTWEKLLADDKILMDNLDVKGQEIRDFVETLDTAQMMDTAYPCVVDGKSAVVTNGKSGCSLIFASYKKPTDVQICYGWSSTLNAWKYTVYQVNKAIPVDAIARKFGGNGHEGAAGWTGSLITVPLGSVEGQMRTYTDIFKPIFDYCEVSQLARMYLKNEFRGAFMSRGFITNWKGHTCFAINYNISCAEIFAEGDVRDATLGITFTWTSCGEYRIMVRPLKRGVSLDALAQQLYPEVTAGTLSYYIVNGAIWFYSKELPFHTNQRPTLVY